MFMGLEAIVRARRAHSKTLAPTIPSSPGENPAKPGRRLGNGGEQPAARAAYADFSAPSRFFGCKRIRTFARVGHHSRPHAGHPVPPPIPTVSPPQISN